MKKHTRKGFTVIELVIVIAVIAILAVVLIPTFSRVINKANDSAALQEARGILTNYLADAAEDGDTINAYIRVGEAGSYKYFKVENGKLDKNAVEAPTTGLIISDAENDGTVETETATTANT